MLNFQVVVEELEGRIAACHERGVEDEAGYERANQASAAARVLVGTSLTTPATSMRHNLTSLDAEPTK